MDFSFVLEILPSLIQSLPVTIYVFLVALIVSFLWAVIITYFRVRKTPVISQILEAYTSFTRSTPGIVHIFLVYYGLPLLLRTIGISTDNVSRVTFSIIALVMYTGGFISEILRPSYLAVSSEQHDAAKSIGMTGFQSHMRIIFPQVIPVALPSLGNAWINLLLDTSLLFLIGLVDLMGQAEIIIANTYGVYQFEVYFTVALIYWALSSLLTTGVSALERHYSKYMKVG